MYNTYNTYNTYIQYIQINICSRSGYCSTITIVTGNDTITETLFLRPAHPEVICLQSK